MSQHKPFKIVSLFAYGGPNIFSPQPGVLLRLVCDSDRSKQIRHALKESAQSAGTLLAHLDISAHQQHDGYLISVSFATPVPTIGAALATYVVEGLHAQENGDTDWDANTPLDELRQRVRQEMPNSLAWRLLADARTHDVPFIRRLDGLFQCGYGASQWVFDQATLQKDALPIPPWQHIGEIPIYAVTGERDRATTVQTITTLLEQTGIAVTSHPSADFDTVVALLQDTATRCLVVGLDTADMLRRGIPFDRCTLSIITDNAGDCPAEAATPDEWIKALGLPMLVASGPVVLATESPHIAALATYAPHDVYALAHLEDVILKYG